jgi:hypothetical protein
MEATAQIARKNAKKSQKNIRQFKLIRTPCNGAQSGRCMTAGM